jgi:hypothetical protein
MELCRGACGPRDQPFLDVTGSLGSEKLAATSSFDYNPDILREPFEAVAPKDEDLP